MKALPNHFYTRREEFLEERERVFAPMWVCIGFASDAPNAGDVQPMEFMEMPLLMVRGSDQTLRVFHNVCRHRGHVLVSERGTVKQSLRCPYHSWTYTLEGKLARTPNIGGVGINDVAEFDRAGFGNPRSESEPANEHTQSGLCVVCGGVPQATQCATVHGGYCGAWFGALRLLPVP